MKTNSLLISLSFLLSAVVLSSCVKETELIEDFSQQEVVFVIDDASFSVSRGAMVESQSQMPSMQVLAYDNSTDAEFINQTAMYSNSSWTLYPAVNWGNVTSANFTAFSPVVDIYNENGISLEGSDIDYTVLTYYMPEYSENQPDLIVATTSAAAGSSVSVSFKHMLASVGFNVKGTDMTVKSIAVKNIKNYGTLTIENATTNYMWTSKCTDANKSFYVSIEQDVDIDNLTSPLTSDGYMMVLPQQIQDYTLLTVNYVNGEGLVYAQDYGFPDNTQWEEGKSYTYNIYYDKDDAVLQEDDDEDNTGSGGGSSSGGTGYEGDYLVWDYTPLSSSNCYIVNPSTEADDAGVIYYIPVEDRVNDYYVNYAQESDPLASNPVWTTKLIWYDATDASDFKSERAITGFMNDGITSALKITVPKSIQEGNFVVALQIASSTVWSWHFWVTTYNPYDSPVMADADGRQFTVEGGELHRYVDAGVFQDGGIYQDLYVMDRNIGARWSKYGHGGAAGAVYYQWGRKDPFPGSGGVYYSGYENLYTTNSTDGFPYAVTYSNSTAMSVAVKNPEVFMGTIYETWNTWTEPDLAGHGDWCKDPYEYTDLDNNMWRDVNVAYTTSLEEETAKKKSIYDPSPWGWRVPLSDITEDFFAVSDGKASSSYDTADTEFDYAANASSNISKESFYYIYREVACYPYEGYLYAYKGNYTYRSNYYDALSVDGTAAYNWTADVYNIKNFTSSNGSWYADDYAKYMYQDYDASYTYKCKGGSRGYAYPIRPVQEVSESPYDLIKAEMAK